MIRVVLFSLLLCACATQPAAKSRSMCGNYFTMIAELKADGFFRWWSYLPPGQNKSRVENWINTEKRESVKLIVPPPYHSCTIGEGIELKIYKEIKP